MKNDGLILEFCGSGFFQSFRLNLSDRSLQKELTLNLISGFQFLNSQLRGDVKTSFLFNAFTDEVFIDRLTYNGFDVKSLSKSSGGSMFADSGGLQILTVGAEINQEMRRQIYKFQAEHSDFSMSFDRLPFKIVGDRKQYLGHEICGQYGVMAGFDLKEQIEYFDNVGSDSKIFPILQGRGEGIQRYVDGLFQPLSKDQLDNLNCLAVGGIIWASPFEILKIVFDIYNRLDHIPTNAKQHFHCLGLNGFRRSMGVIIAAKNGLYPSLQRLSFDSARLFMSYIVGEYVPTVDDLKSREKWRPLGKKRSQFVEDYYEQMWIWWKDNPNNVFLSFDDLIEHSVYNSRGLRTGKQQFIELGFDDGLKTILQEHVYILFNVYKYIDILESYLRNEIVLDDFLKHYPNLYLLKELQHINDAETFQRWFDSIGTLIEPKPKPECNFDPVNFLF